MTLKPSDAARFMAKADELRRAALAAGDQSYGAVVVKDGKIVGFGPSRVVTKGDPTAHAEMEAIRDAAARLKTQDLSGCTMVSTSKPCPMCETAAHWASLDELIYTSALTNGGAPRYRRCLAGDCSLALRPASRSLEARAPMLPPSYGNQMSQAPKHFLGAPSSLPALAQVKVRARLMGQSL